MDSMMCLTRVSIFDARLLLVFLHTRARTRPRDDDRAHASARTLAARQSVQSILWGFIPTVCVHDLAKRLEMYIIPDNLCKRRVEL